MLILAAVLVAASPAAADVASQITVCVAAGKGTLYHVAEGGSPSEPCADGDRAITWNIAGPAGPQGPPGPPAPAPARFRFVGVTTATFSGSAGRLAMTRACNARFPGSRMAFTDEIVDTVAPPDIEAEAWVQPRPTLHTPGNGGVGVIYDAAGSQLFLAGASPLDCDSWDSDSGGTFAPTVTPRGSIHYRDCSMFLRVACSAPE